MDWLRRKGMLACTLAAMVCAWLLTPPREAPRGSAEAIFPLADRIDVGEVGYGETKPATFVLTNGGTDTVTLVGAAVTCVCVSVNGLPLELPPGGSGVVTAEIRGISPPGESFEQPVRIICDRGRRTPLLLTIAGRGAGTATAPPSRSVGQEPQAPLDRFGAEGGGIMPRGNGGRELDDAAIADAIRNTRDAATRAATRHENVAVIGHCAIAGVSGESSGIEDAFWFRVARRGDEIVAEKLDPIDPMAIGGGTECGPGVVEAKRGAFRGRSIVAATDRYDFLVRRRGPEGAWAVERLDDDPARLGRIRLIQAASPVLAAIEAPCSVFGVALDGMLGSDEWHAASAAVASGGAITISYGCSPEFAPRGGVNAAVLDRVRVVGGRLTVDPARDWAAVAHEATLRLADQEAETLTFADRVDCRTVEGVTVPALLERVLVPEQAGQPAITATIHVAAIEFGGVNDDSFRLSSVGLPEPAAGSPSSQPRRGETILPVLLLAVGIAAIAAVRSFRRPWAGRPAGS